MPNCILTLMLLGEAKLVLVFIWVFYLGLPDLINYLIMEVTFTRIALIIRWFLMWVEQAYIVLFSGCCWLGLGNIYVHIFITTDHNMAINIVSKGYLRNNNWQRDDFSRGANLVTQIWPKCKEGIDFGSQFGEKWYLFNVLKCSNKYKHHL